ncbi:DSBA-like thioredoxin domain-containing protein [Micromonospora phaseoli]|uniref:DSBA-like thioredoxin domain-containing protein n=1 Tax=Micromonospora phaseoli TaxID=1144548 RepID=A0A1H7DNG3_9ACTN|nr:DsbA family protein [Micromonospora phaseoli]PZV89452.1 DSBA-like thioredoxin domain-containing protein [Micromonospora phaseoli]GIJ80275.1 DSBA oxidoreductase [Micromonospora phaseoli]SEK02914.1 DSBA-like thioredoxin domain-containing protein [Micromonospora phaseoli]
MDATFFFDPLCPWTWRTSRWLVSVAEARDLRIEWRAFSLAILNGGDVPPEYAEAMTASTRSLRLVEALRAEGRHDDVGRFYTELGTRTHDVGNPPSDKLVAAAVEAAGLDDAAPALDDESWDAQVHASHALAYASAGPDIGSPVLMVPGADRGLHGPILTEVPGADDALVLWDSVVPLMRMPAFHELKRARH